MTEKIPFFYLSTVLRTTYNGNASSEMEQNECLRIEAVSFPLFVHDG